ncbi:hypothetical protein GBAR_LOCUS23174 [Geodia barretti]|uniref:Uncharacterized protein n=1 Tax=Geodia barretti TaxID=519541 RepID=A0AA35T7H2_GEOBA|nr:hypothetical protein GBAR_LOCUS23174 [Geodia barretti]
MFYAWFSERGMAGRQIYCAGRVVKVWRRGSTGIAPSLRPHDVGDIQYSR